MALLRHANEHLECLLSEVVRKSGFRLGRTVFDPSGTCGKWRGICSGKVLDLFLLSTGYWPVLTPSCLI
jgi:hypothetical protein